MRYDFLADLAASATHFLNCQTLLKYTIALLLEMNYRNCSVLDILLLILLLLDSSWSLTSPDCNQDTHELEKYVVSIRSRRPQIIFGDNHFCVGTIIAPKFVLTAAKCTMSTLKVMHLTRSLIVVGGTPNRLIEVQNTVSRKVKDIFLPENFVKKNRNDIALIQLQESWPTNNPGIDIINLPSEEPPNGTEFLVLGWGRFYEGGPLAGNLVHIKVELLEHSKCNQMIQKLQPEMLCAGNVSDIDMNPCAGDTGGPMIYNHTIYGLVSYRVGCGHMTMPSIYTDVWYHMDWIEKTLRNCCLPCVAQAKLCISLFALTVLSAWKAI